MPVMQCLCVSFLEWPHPLSFSSRDFQRGETHENRILERAPGAVTDARPAAALALSFSPSGARLFLEGHTSPLSLQSYKDIIMQFNLNTQSKLSAQFTQDGDSADPELLWCHRQEVFSLLMVSKDFQIPVEAFLPAELIYCSYCRACHIHTSQPSESMERTDRKVIHWTCDYIPEMPISFHRLNGNWKNSSDVDIFHQCSDIQKSKEIYPRF